MPGSPRLTLTGTIRNTGFKVSMIMSIVLSNACIPALLVFFSVKPNLFKFYLGEGYFAKIRLKINFS
jgi:hypothetical protein